MTESTIYDFGGVSIPENAERRPIDGLIPNSAEAARHNSETLRKLMG